jgi:hypothetical protein
MYLPAGTPQAAPILIEEKAEEQTTVPKTPTPPPAPTHPANSGAEIE